MVQKYTVRAVILFENYCNYLFTNSYCLSTLYYNVFAAMSIFTIINIILRIGFIYLFFVKNNNPI